MALDRLGARECDDIKQISEALREGKIVTILANRHFRNIVGVLFNEHEKSYYFRICDSSCKKTYFEKIDDTFSKLLSAWVWE